MALSNMASASPKARQALIVLDAARLLVGQIASTSSGAVQVPSCPQSLMHLSILCMIQTCSLMAACQCHLQLLQPPQRCSLPLSVFEVDLAAAVRSKANHSQNTAIPSSVQVSPSLQKPCLTTATLRCVLCADGNAAGCTQHNAGAAVVPTPAPGRVDSSDGSRAACCARANVAGAAWQGSGA